MSDRDTYLAEKIFPKVNPTRDRKLRTGVKSVMVFEATRKTKLTLCLLASWAVFMPVYNLARLSSLTRSAGYTTKVYDFNIQAYYDLRAANSDLEDAWNGANFWWWDKKDYFTKIHPTHEPFLIKYMNQILSDEPDIIGFSCYRNNIVPTIWMIGEIKKIRPDITIILGGPECHWLLPPNQSDYYFVGESEQNLLDFLNNWEQGIKPTEKKIGSLYSDTRIDIDSLPYPDYSDFDLAKYIGKNTICSELSRGCIAKCTYCTEVYYWKYRDRGATTVVDELEYQVNHYGVTFVQFVDSLMNGNLKEFRRFCEELIKRDLKIGWWGYMRADGRMDLEFYKLMKAAGLQGANYGFESGSDKVLKAVNKKNTVADINQNIIDSAKVGMLVSACMVIGAPGEDIEAYNHTLNMLWNHKKRIVAVAPGAGLGDDYGSAYDDREKFNINHRDKPWADHWYTLDFKNTQLHRFIRVKLLFIWCQICKDTGGTFENVYRIQGDIKEHYSLICNNEPNEHVEYEDFDYSIINSGQGDFADSVMNEVFGFLRMLWRVMGSFEIKIPFNKEIDSRDFSSALLNPNNFEYQTDIWFKIDDNGNYSVKNSYYFIDRYRNKVDGIKNFRYVFESNGVWVESKKTQSKKVFAINPLS